MKRFDIITIFPHILDSYINESILARAQKKKLIKIQAHDLRKWTTDKRKTVDDRPYGGGPGMLFKVEPIFKAVKAIIKKQDAEYKIQKTRPNFTLQKLRRAERAKVILLSAKGKTFNQKIAKQLAKQDRLIFICGRYEGVDERAAKHIADMELSVGSYILAGGELPAIMIIEAVSRLVPGVLGKAESLAEESFSSVNFKSYKLKTKNFLEYPQYTRPKIFITKNRKKWRVPKILLSGNHKKIKEWRIKMQKAKDNAKI